MKKDLILIGAGGHCISVIDTIELQNEYSIKGILDSQKEIGTLVLGYPVLGNDDSITSFNSENTFFLITVGQISSSKTREKIAHRLTNNKIATIISPKAYISKYATIKEGTVILNGANINAGATIGKHCIINSQANIEHGVVVEDFCHISTGAVINGDCVVEKACFVGSNATLVQGTKFPSNSTLAAGSVLVKSQNESGLYAGVPASLKHKN